MATNYPGSLDTSTQQPSPTASTEMDDSGFEHDVVHTNHSGAIIAVETKVGTGASTPVANSVLGGTGSGTSAWTTTPTLGGLAVSGTISQPWGNEITQTGVANTKLIDVSFTGGLGNHVDLSVPNNGSAGLGDTVMRLVDGGNIGIGAATPDTLLHVSGSTDTVAHFESTDAEGMIAFSDSASTGNWYDRRIGVHGDDLSFVTNGARRMTIQDDGQVGIGTTTPYAPLQVFNSATDTVARFGSGDAGVYLSFYDNTSANETNARIGAYGDKLVFLAGGSDRMVIASDGDMGIGTTTPGQRLHVNSGTADTVAVFESSDTGAYIGMKDDTSGSNLHVAVAAIGNDLALRSGNSNTVRIKGDTQRVGIGTTDPQRVLEVADNVPAIRLTDDNNAGVYHEILGDGASLSIEADDNNQASSSSINFKVDGSQKATITSDGRLGIGTSSPSLPLHVATGGADHGILVVSTDSVARINMQDDSTTDAYAVGVGATGNNLSLFAGSAERATLKSDGDFAVDTDTLLVDASQDRVGVNHSSPVFPLHAYGSTVDSVVGVESGDAGAYVAFIDSDSTGNSYDRRIGATGDDLKFQTGATDRMTIKADGKVGIGTTSPGTSLHVNAGAVNNAAIFESTDAGALISLKDNTTSGNSYVGLRADGDILKLRSNNTNQVTISANGNVTFLGSLLAPNGSTSAPAYSFTNDSNTGFYVTGNGGVIRFVGNGTEGGYVYSGGIRTVDGSASAPAYAFSDDADTGMYSDGSNSISFATAGTQRLDIDGGGIKGKVTFSGTYGSASAPGFSFDGDTDTGMYRYGANEIGFACGGAVKASVTGHINVHTTDGSLVAYDPPTGTGNDAEWVSVFGVYLLRRNSSTAAEKLKIQDDLEGWLTPDMVDSVVPKMWTRDHAPEYPEIGPIADDMDVISPFLGVKGTNENGEQVLTGIDRNAYLSLLVLAVKDLRQRVVELEDA